MQIVWYLVSMLHLQGTSVERLISTKSHNSVELSDVIDSKIL